MTLRLLYVAAAADRGADADFCLLLIFDVSSLTSFSRHVSESANEAGQARR